MPGVTLILSFAVFVGTVVIAQEGSHYNNCTTNFTVLERALVTTGSNRFNIIRAFYPPRKARPVYVDVEYHYAESNVTEYWVWTTSPFYLIQPPSVFQFTSLLFSYPALSDQIQNLSLTLPHECRDVTFGNRTCNQNLMLDMLTHQLHLYAQSSEYFTVIREDTSANAVCDQDLDVYRNDKVISIFLTCVVAFPFLLTTLLITAVKGCHTEIGERLTETTNYANIAALALTGIIFSVYVTIMDALAIVFIYANNHELSKYNIFLSYSLSSHSLTFFFDALVTLLAVGALFYLACFDECVRTTVVGWNSNQPQQPQVNLNQSQQPQVNVLHRYFARCIFPFEKLDDLTEDLASGDAGNKYRMWILTFTFVAPMFCIGSHAVYIVLACISDPIHSGSATFVTVLSFFYYFFTFRVLYQLLANTKHVRECCSCTEYEAIEDQAGSQNMFKFWVLVVELLIGVVLLAFEGFFVYAFIQLPFSTYAIPSNIFSLLQLAALVLSGLVVYKILAIDTRASA